MKTEKILFVDDESNILSGYKRSLRNRYQIDTAVGGNEGLEKIRNEGPYAVIISDYKMPEMNGVEFLQQARLIEEDSVRVLLTGQADTNAIIAAINEGHIFRFLNKPCPAEQLEIVIGQCVHQNRLLHAEKDLLERTLNGSTHVLVEILSLVNPLAFSQANRIKAWMLQMVRQLGLPEPWSYELASMLSHIGCVSVPEKVIQDVLTGTPLSSEDAKLFESHPELGRSLIAQVPRLEKVANMVANQNRNYNAYTEQAMMAEPEAFWGGQLLKTLTNFDLGLRQEKSKDEVITNMSELPEVYCPMIVNLLPALDTIKCQATLVSINIDELTLGMRFAEDVYNTVGILLVASGQEVHTSTIARLRNFSRIQSVPEPLKMWKR